MKNFLNILFVLLVIASCTKEEKLFNKVQEEAPVFTSSFEEYNIDNKTKTYIDENVKLLWHQADELSIFRSTLNQKYLFDGETGDNSGTFTLDAGGDQFGTGNTISRNYAVYPYLSTSKLSNDEILTVTLPDTQAYAEHSFGRGANTMVAVTSDLQDRFLPFKNLGGYLVLKLYGNDITVKTITLRGNDSEKLAGTATVTAQYGQNPSVEMADTATETITIDCGQEGVKLGTSESDYTQFWFVVPPTSFSEGFTVTIQDMEGGVMEQSTSNAMSIERNVVNSMQPLNVVINRIDVSALVCASTTNLNKSNYSDINEGISVAGVEVQFRNHETGKIYEAVVGADNLATANIVPGHYMVTINGSVEYNGANCIVSDVIPSVNLSEDIPAYVGEELNEDCIVMRPRLMKKSSLVLSELYYCGASNQYHYFRDQTYHIYNNGDKTEYIDGLCVAELYPHLLIRDATNAVWPEDDGINNYVYARVVWQFPGDGDDYPIQPGEAVVICQQAKNHYENMTDPSDVTVDNSMANWECWAGNANRDNPDVPNMEPLFREHIGWGFQWLASVFGPAICIFRPDSDIDLGYTTWPSAYDSVSGKYYPKIYYSWIIDGVECTDSMSLMAKKRVPGFVDMGIACGPSATYVGKPVSRKVIGQKANGTPVFADTNNSLNDFEILDTPAIRRYGIKAPVWPQ